MSQLCMTMGGGWQYGEVRLIRSRIHAPTTAAQRSHRLSQSRGGPEPNSGTEQNFVAMCHEITPPGVTVAPAFLARPQPPCAQTSGRRGGTRADSREPDSATAARSRRGVVPNVSLLTRKPGLRARRLGELEAPGQVEIPGKLANHARGITDSERIRRNVLGDQAAGADDCAFADLHTA